LKYSRQEKAFIDYKSFFVLSLRSCFRPVFFVISFHEPQQRGVSWFTASVISGFFYETVFSRSVFRIVLIYHINRLLILVQKSRFFTAAGNARKENFILFCSIG